MNNEKFWKECTLSRSTLDILKSLRNELKEDVLRANPIWSAIGGKVSIRFDDLLNIYFDQDPQRRIYREKMYIAIVIQTMTMRMISLRKTKTTY